MAELYPQVHSFQENKVISVSLMTDIKSMFFGKKERHCHVISLYPKEPKALDLMAVLNLIIDWSKDVGLEPPDWMEFDAVNKKMGNPAPYKRAYDKLDKLDGIRDIEAILCNKALDGVDNRFVGWRWFVALDRLRSLSVFVECSVVAEFEHHAKQLIAAVGRIAPIQYGFETVIPFSKGPYFYVNGTLYEGEKQYSRKEGERLAKWNHALLACRKTDSPVAEGYLRDVYEMNVLSESQLSIVIDGLKLSNWITKNSSRGYLEVLNDKLCIWSVPEGSLNNLRRVLGQARLTVCYGGFETQSATT